MRPIVRHGTRLATASRTRHSSVPHQPYSQAQRFFSTSFQRSSEPRAPPSSVENQSAFNSEIGIADSHRNESTNVEHAAEAEQGEEKSRAAAEVEDVEDKPVAETRKSSPRWNGRRKRVNEVPRPPPIPQWFLGKNVRLVEHIPSRNFGNTGTARSIQCVDGETGHILFTLPWQFGIEDTGVLDVIVEQATRKGWQRTGEMARRLYGREWEQRQDRIARRTARKDPMLTSQITQATDDASIDDTHSSTVVKQNNCPGDGGDSVQPQDQEYQKFVPRLSIDAELVEWPSDPLSWCFLEAEAGLRSALSTADNDRQSASFAVDRVDLSLQCPDPNSHDQLDEFVDDIAGVLAADIIRLDANDFAELSEDYVGLGDDSPGSFSNMGYDVFDGYSAARLHSSVPLRQQTNTKEHDEMEDDEEDEHDEHNDSPKNVFAVLGDLEIKSHDLLLRSGEALKRLRTMKDASMDEPRHSDPSKHDARLDALLDGLLDSASRKRSIGASINGLSIDEKEIPSLESSFNTMTRFFQMHPRLWQSQASRLLTVHLHSMINPSPNGQGAHKLLLEPKPCEPKHIANADHGTPLLVHIRDLRDICNSSLGDNIIRRLVKVVRKRRKAGERVVIVGTTAQDVPGPIRLPGDRSDDFPFWTLSVPPIFQQMSRHEMSKLSELSRPIPQQALDDPGYRRILEINLRHIQAMLRRFNTPPGMDLASREAYSQLNQPGTHSLTERIFSLDEVQRLTLVAIGLSQSYAIADELCPLHVALAATITARNDHLMQSWQAFKEQKDWTKSKPQSKSKDVEVDSKDENSDQKLGKLKESANAHEKRLLSGVVDSRHIKTRFADVHAPTEIIDALKTLTSLSLLRPDAFKYGVLANDRLPGLLLYGPPGTGKTLLAKAVAKDSQATVLEVTGAQIYEKYVGEGEKMVRAVFSLAKKLSPCVVFIDEADAIFGSRSDHGNRNTHREIINQFLREWDGMDNHSVLMVLASNRPFDLDDAALRRLPRRLLIDLPLARDRESILGIHLKDENLDSSVSLNKLAEQTPLYSGSDLKNLSVAAALACVREENELVESRKDDTEFKLPEKRTLTSQHFDKALAEISASISENMSSLAAIRKFDEQYGDRKGRRKTTNYGFGASDGSIDESAARVRQSASSSP